MRLREARRYRLSGRRRLRVTRRGKQQCREGDCANLAEPERRAAFQRRCEPHLVCRPMLADQSAPESRASAITD
jgi:hypothetical protein